MTVSELFQRFPEIPNELQNEPVLSELAEHCGELLAVARKPSNCSVEHEASNHYYLKLIGPISIYGFGLSSREKLLEQLRSLLDRQAEDPSSFASTLLPDDTADREVKGPACD